VVSFEARPVSRLIKDSVQAQLRGPQSNADLPVPFTTILLGFAGLVLGIACLNFVNLATARSASRAREIGVRKSLGAGARAVLQQDLVETAVGVALSLVLALALVAVAGQFVEDRWQPTLALPWTRPQFGLLLGALLAGVTVLAGVYPAAVLARIRPLTALRLGFARARAPARRRCARRSLASSALPRRSSCSRCLCFTCKRMHYGARRSAGSTIPTSCWARAGG
jgi:hypothetical protein